MTQFSPRVFALSVTLCLAAPLLGGCGDSDKDKLAASGPAAPGPTVVDGARNTLLTELRAAEQSGRDNAAKACADAPGDRAVPT